MRDFYAGRPVNRRRKYYLKGFKKDGAMETRQYERVENWGQLGAGRDRFTSTMNDWAAVLASGVLFLALMCLLYKGIGESSLGKPSAEETRVLKDWDTASQEQAWREAGM